MDEPKSNNERSDHDAFGRGPHHPANVPAPNGIINIPRPQQAQQYIHEDEEDAVTDYNVS
jgi:hypothetical protein